MQKIIIYDAKCNFCSRFAAWSILKNPSLISLSVRDNTAKSILRNFGVKFIDLQTIYYINEDIVFVRSRAIFNICKEFKFPWLIIFYFNYLPVRLTDFFYKKFAKYRYYF